MILQLLLHRWSPWSNGLHLFPLHVKPHACPLPSGHPSCDQTVIASLARVSYPLFNVRGKRFPTRHGGHVSQLYWITRVYTKTATALWVVRGIPPSSKTTLPRSLNPTLFRLLITVGFARLPSNSPRSPFRYLPILLVKWSPSFICVIWRLRFVPSFIFPPPYCLYYPRLFFNPQQLYLRKKMVEKKNDNLE